MTTDDRTVPQLRACAAIVECAQRPTSARLAAFLWDLADKLDTPPEGDEEE